MRLKYMLYIILSDATPLPVGYFRISGRELQDRERYITLFQQKSQAVTPYTFRPCPQHVPCSPAPRSERARNTLRTNGLNVGRKSASRKVRFCEIKARKL